MADLQALKDRVLDAVNFAAEFDEVLGPGKGTTRKCFNKGAHAHGDKSASLSFSATNGSWRCHVCSMQGDIFALFREARGESYPDCLARLAVKYGVSVPNVNTNPKDFTPRKSPWSTIKDPELMGSVSRSRHFWNEDTTVSRKVKAVVDGRYGLSIDTLKKWAIGYDSGRHRLIIPIPRNSFDVVDGKMVGQIINVRMHDIMRKSAMWKKETEEVRNRPEVITDDDYINQRYSGWTPFYPKDKGPGKVMNVAGHGACYLYPISVLQGAPVIYLVGGELKALLMNQVGLPAVTFTGGEGSYSNDLLPYFNGKKVRVVYDADPEKPRDENGKCEMDRKADKIAEALVEAGAALVEIGRWPNFLLEQLPPGGDVTDLLVRCGLQAEAVEKGLIWERWDKSRKQGRATNTKTLRNKNNVKPQEVDKGTVAGLRHADMVGKWMEVVGVVSGKGETPSVVPSSVVVSCNEGRSNETKMCKSCPLPTCGFATRIDIDETAQLDFIGMPVEMADSKIAKAIGVPPRCPHPQVERSNNAAQQILITPPVDVIDDEDYGDPMATASLWVLSDNRTKLQDSSAYRFTVRVVPDPRTSRFTGACTSFEPVVNSVFNYSPNDEADSRLMALSAMPLHEAIDRVVGDLRDFHVKTIFGADGMLLASLVGMHTPMEYSVGGQDNARKCSSVLILGDTTTGKSTVMNAVHKLYGVGRMIAADAKPTYAGLIGGVSHDNGTPIFQWGPIPLSNRGALAFDEFAQLNPEIISGLTSLLSSGIAERRTRLGSGKVEANIRFTYLSNPRGTDRLTDYRNPMDAAAMIFGTPQDLGRVDFVHVQYQVEDDVAFAYRAAPKRDVLYDKAAARQHISWSWTRGHETILFTDPRRLYDEAYKLAKYLQDPILLLSPMARFKIAKLSASFALIANRRAKDNAEICVVDNDAVEYAIQQVKGRYEAYMNGGCVAKIGDTTKFSTDVCAILDQVKDYSKLAMLATGESFYTLRDFINCCGSADLGIAMLEQLYNIEGRMTAGNSGRYLLRNPVNFAKAMSAYIESRNTRKMVKR